MTSASSRCGSRCRGLHQSIIIADGSRHCRVHGCHMFRRARDFRRCPASAGRRCTNPAGSDRRTSAGNPHVPAVKIESLGPNRGRPEAGRYENDGCRSGSGRDCRQAARTRPVRAGGLRRLGTYEQLIYFAGRVSGLRLGHRTIGRHCCCFRLGGPLLHDALNDDLDRVQIAQVHVVLCIAEGHALLAQNFEDGNPQVG